MSLWSREQLRVLFCPGSLVLLAGRRLPHWLGMRQSDDDEHAIRVPQGSAGPAWQPALDALTAALSEHGQKGSHATVLLSNQFVRYLLVPWQAELGDAQEDLAYVRHCFARVYGKSDLPWELRLEGPSPTGLRLASAVDGHLLAALREAFGRAGIRLESIQPHLMAAFNAGRVGLPPAGGWLALVEPGHLCLALVDHGRWARVHSVRVGREWQQDLVALLDRERFLRDDATLPRQVYVHALDHIRLEMPVLDGWEFRPFAPPAVASTSAPAPDLAPPALAATAV
ncbi:MAG: hypothetical protein JWP41_4713 [Ramlibacter sp.]|nr:hypothetical protein [Ramlibacter sp.]